MADAQPTFSWTGIGRQEGACIYYTSFTFAGEPYALGDCVYLLPEEEGAPPYIAKLIRAWEDTTADDAEKLIIEVRWFERRGAVPAAIAAGMHQKEVVASDLTDTNLVGCLDCRATVIRADSYAEACEMLPASQRNGKWHFCRGILETATQQFKSFQELGIGPEDDEFGLKAATASQFVYSGLAPAQLIGQDYASYCCTALNMQHQAGDVEMADAAATESNHASPNNRGNGRNSNAAAASLSGPAAHCAANSRSRRAAAAARVAAAAAAAGASNSGSSVRGIPGKVCCECGATQTPQWREGPLGPKTLCNACGVRYQRSQSKAKSNKRQASERARNGAGADRGSPMHARALKQTCLSNRATAPGGAAGGETAEDGTAHHGHGTRNAGKSRFHQHKQRAGSSKQHHGQQQPPSQQQNVSNGLYDLHYYEDEGSPPNINTHILEDEEEEDAMHQQLLKDSLNRSATHDAADILHSLAAPSHARQAQQQPISAGYCSMVMGSPSSSMLLTDHLQSDNIPLLSLDDTVRLGGPDGVLTGPDSLDPHSLRLPDGLNPHSLSPMPPNRRLSITTGSGSKQGTTPAAGGASASCASPGRLIAAMVQGLRLPAPLSLNGGGSVLPPASAAQTAAADVRSGAQQQHGQQQQQVAPSMLVPSTDGAGQLSVGMQYQPILTSNGLLLPLIGSSSNISQQLHNSSSGPAANTSTPAAHGSDSAPASAAVSSCDASGTPVNTLQGSSSLTHPTAAGWFAAGLGNNSSNPLLSQLCSLVYRASTYAPDVQGLSGLYPGPSSPRAVHGLAQQLEQLAEPAKVQLQQVSAALEENLSKAKAADAAVLAVSQVLAAKKQAAAEARHEVESAMLQFRTLLGKVSPAVAAAAPGNGCSSGEACGTVYCSPGACTTAATNCCAAVSSAAVQCTAMTAGSGSLVGTSRLGGNSPRVLVSQGLDLGTIDDGEGLGSHSNTVHGLGDTSDADDLIRDPEDEQPAVAAATYPQQQQQQEGDPAPDKVQCGSDPPTAAAVPKHTVKAEPEQQQPPATNVPVKQEFQLTAPAVCHLQQQPQQGKLSKAAAAEVQLSSGSADSVQVTGLLGTTDDTAQAVPVQPASAAHAAAEPARVAA